MNDSSKTARIAYLTGQYPAVSHTFILREVEALKALGFDVRPCSVRRAPDSHLTGAPEKAAAAETFYVLKTARNPRDFLAAQLGALRDPARYWRALRLAWTTSGPGFRAHLYQLFYLAEAAILARHFRAQGITHLHNHFADVSANVAMLAAALADIPFSYTLHGPAELYEPKRHFLHTKTARAKFVACISFFARSQAMYFSDPRHWDKIKIIHCGIEPELYARKRKVPSRTDDAHFVFVGRLTAIKGVRVLLGALALAHKDRPNLRLTLVGDGDDRAHLEKLAAPLGDSVRFVGYQSQENVAQILSEADAFVLPSFAEGLPVVLMEALASGIPVISSNVAGVSELVEDGVNGFLVPPGDGETLAARIVALADDPGLRQRMGKSGRQKVRQEFNINTEAARIASLFLDRGGDDIRPPVFERGAAN